MPAATFKALAPSNVATGKEPLRVGSRKSQSTVKQRRLKLRGRLIPQSKSSRPRSGAYAFTAPAVGYVARCLLVLSALSVLTMPITEHLWNSDRFLETGRDFELGTLVVLSFLCLVLVLSKQCKQRVESLFSGWCILASKLIDRATRGICLSGKLSIFYLEPMTAPGTGKCYSPLLI